MSRGIRQAKPVEGHRPKCRAAMPRCPSCGIRILPEDMGLALCPVCGGSLMREEKSRFLSEYRIGITTNHSTNHLPIPYSDWNNQVAESLFEKEFPRYISIGGHGMAADGRSVGMIGEGAAEGHGGSDPGAGGSYTTIGGIREGLGVVHVGDTPAGVPAETVGEIVLAASAPVLRGDLSALEGIAWACARALKEESWRERAAVASSVAGRDISPGALRKYACTARKKGYDWL